MAKVIVERPRWGSSMPSRKKGYRRQLQRTPVEEQSIRESMLGRWHGRDRSLNEHLGPMRRFLRSNIGRPWNKIHQELCEHISFANSVQSHVLDHIDDYVERNAVLIQGRPAHAVQTWRGLFLRVGQMYVCSRTGILKEVRPELKEKPFQRLRVAADLLCLFQNGEWWEVRIRPIPQVPRQLWDVWLERDVARLTTSDCIAAYGDEMFAVSKRALSREERQQLQRRHRSRRE